MSFNEIINSNGHILYWEPSSANRVNKDKILGMDLDWTLIRPVKGKIHPIDENDWKLLYSNLEVIKQKQSQGYKFIIFTNQGGLLSKKGGQMGVDQFKKRWYHILEKLESEHSITSVYMLVSLYDDFNRKPCTGMWEYVEKELNGNIRVDRKASLYIGDMAGRKGDYSASDLLFAMNLEVVFQVPEVFFEGNSDSSSKNNTTKLIKNVLADETLFNGQKFLETFDKKIIKTNNAIASELCAILGDKAVQSLVLFVGSPASGKTSYYHRYLEDLPGLEYLSMDKFKGTPAKFIKQVDMHLGKGSNVLIDNTNGNKKSREKFINIARSMNKKISVIIVHMETEKRICMHLNALRTKKNNIACAANSLDKKDSDLHNVPAVAIHTYWKNFQEPNMNTEDIDSIYTVQYEPAFITANDSTGDSSGDSTSDNIKNGLKIEEFMIFL